MYFFGHTPGHSIHRWRHGRKWELFFNPSNAPKGAQFDDLAEADHLLPTSSSYGTEEFHTFIEHTRASFNEAVKQAWEVPSPVTRREQFGWTQS